MTKLEEAIKALESKGYEVIARENRWLGKLSETYPIVYDIYNGSDRVYGANAIAPESLELWLDLPSVKKEEVKAPEETAPIEEEKAKEWDDCYNEGGEGYNPYRDPKPMKVVKMAADTMSGKHIVATQPLTVGEQVIYEGEIVTVTEILHTAEKAYKALGEGSTYAEQVRNAYMVQHCWARVDRPFKGRDIEVLKGNGLPEGLPQE